MDESPCSNGEKIRESAFAGMPIPVSLTSMTSLPLAALRLELQRVPNQIRENLFKLARIGSDVAMPSLQPKVDPNPRPFLLVLEILEYKADHLVRVHLHELQPQGLVRDMGGVEQLGD